MSESDNSENIKDDFFIEDSQSKFFKKFVNLYNKSQNKYYIKIIYKNPKNNNELYIKYADELAKDKEIVHTIVPYLNTTIKQNIIEKVQKYDSLISYPAPYSGQECQKNILYFGACPNQFFDIGIQYALENINNKVIIIHNNLKDNLNYINYIKLYIKEYKSILLAEYEVSIENNYDTINNNIVSLYPKGSIIISLLPDIQNKYFLESLLKIFKKKPENKYVILNSVYTIMTFFMSDSFLYKINKEATYQLYSVQNFTERERDYVNTIKKTISDDPNDILNIIQNQMITTTVYETFVVGQPLFKIFLTFYFFIYFLEKYKNNKNNKNENTGYDATILRKEYIDYIIDKKILTIIGNLNFNNNHHLSQPTYIFKVNVDGRYETIYDTPGNIYPNPWYIPFDEIEYGCNLDVRYL